MTKRKDRATELIRRELSGIIAKDLDLAGALITITRVDVSDDLQYADVYFVTIPDDSAEALFKKFKQNIFSIQQALNKRLRMRPVPKIRFNIDRAEEEAVKIDELLKRV